MLDLLDNPDQYATHLKQYSGGIALGVSFGMSIDAAELETSHLLSNTAAVGADVGLCPQYFLTRLIMVSTLVAIPWPMACRVSSPYRSFLHDILINLL
jgi:hypothetical protein